MQGIVIITMLGFPQATNLCELQTSVYCKTGLEIIVTNVNLKLHKQKTIKKTATNMLCTEVNIIDAVCYKEQTNFGCLMCF
jgi:hypothetical protein